MTGPRVPLTAVVSAGRRLCAVCGQEDQHRVGCAIPGLEAELQALAAAMGLFVADVRERLDGLERLLHGEAG